MNIFTHIRNVCCCCLCTRTESTDFNVLCVTPETRSNYNDNSLSVLCATPDTFSNDNDNNEDNNNEDSIYDCEDVITPETEAQNKENKNSFDMQIDNLEELSKMVIEVEKIISSRLYNYLEENSESIKYYIINDSFLLKKNDLHIFGTGASEKIDNIVIVNLDKNNVLPLLKAGIVSYIYLYKLPEGNTLVDYERYKVFKLCEEDHINTVNDFITKLINGDNDKVHLKELHDYVLTIEQKESYDTKL